MSSKKTDIKAAGIVSTYFQLASHHKCMKHRITSIAFVHETPIIKIQVGLLSNVQYSDTVMNEQNVSMHRQKNTT